VLGGGGGATLDALPMPLGSLTELLTPPTLPGPDGTPLTPVVPAPAEPAAGVPAGLAVAPGAPAFCAKEPGDPINVTVIASARVIGVFDIGVLRLWTDGNGADGLLFRARW
jgi:hypothetical protein